MNKTVHIWEPQPGPQTFLIKCPVSDIFFGGARGGGKTDGFLGHWCYHVAEAKNKSSGLFFRKNVDELETVIKRGKELFNYAAEWKDQKKKFVFFGGGELRLRSLERDTDADKRQGESNTWIAFDELGNHPRPEPIDKIKATLRSAGGVKTFFLGAANPGGVGHNWIKNRYIDPSPPLKPFYDPNIEDYRVFIPAKLTDNKKLIEGDPDYLKKIIAATVGQEWLRKAWVEGSWDIVAGGMFDDIWRREKHVIKPFQIPKAWTIYRAYDWGSSRPFSVGWWACSDGSTATLANGDQKTFSPGTFFRIGEWYGWNKQPNKGLKLLEKQIAKGIIEREKKAGWEVQDGPADSSIFDEENGHSIAKEHKPFGIFWKKADKRPGSRISGWRRIREMLIASTQFPMEEPGLFIFNNCTQFIRTVPILPRDQIKLDDVDTNAEDHVGDETRYMLRYRANFAKMGKLEGF